MGESSAAADGCGPAGCVFTDQREILRAAADCIATGVDEEWSTQNRDAPEEGGFRRIGFHPSGRRWCWVFGDGTLRLLNTDH